MQILFPVPHGAQHSDYIKKCVVHKPRNKPLYDITLTQRCLLVKQMTACEQIRVWTVLVDCFSDPGLHIIQCCMVLHHNEIMSFNCGLSNAKISVSLISNVS